MAGWYQRRVTFYELWTHLLQFFALAVHLLGLGNAVHAVLKVRAPQAAIGWALALTLIPWVAIPLYWVFGRQKFIGYRRAVFGGEDGPLDTLGETVCARLLPFADAPPPGGDPLLSETRGNRIDLLIDGTQTFPAIFEAIDTARHSIIVQFFIIRGDSLGRTLRDRLAAAARDGLRVYLLYDEVGSHGLPTEFFQPVRDAGGQVVPFRTTRGRGNRFQLNFRNHRKLVVTDGRVALTGGLNVGVEYRGENPRFGPWRDTHVRVEGPAVAALQLAFVEDWHWATGKIPVLDWPEPEEAGDVRARVAATGPADELDRCSLFFLDIVNSARRRLWIASPYFVPDPATLAALQLAALRGAEVRIMLPDKADHQLPWLSSFSYYEALRAAGISLYRYQAGFLHQKVILADDERAVVGSVNVDYRSFHLNFELAVMTRSRQFAAEVEAMLEADFARCRRVDLDEAHSAWFRAKVGVARLLSPVQ